MLITHGFATPAQTSSSDGQIPANVYLTPLPGWGTGVSNLVHLKLDSRVYLNKRWSSHTCLLATGEGTHLLTGKAKEQSTGTSCRTDEPGKYTLGGRSQSQRPRLTVCIKCPAQLNLQHGKCLPRGRE